MFVRKFRNVCKNSKFHAKINCFFAKIQINMINHILTPFEGTPNLR